ncbi:hypothetical protein HDU98_010511 [Podochytrium sp. JEL0797]|nr:hypothetical protein HDU98_010511 [Podochytrium sp. JEL0797]
MPSFDDLTFMSGSMFDNSRVGSNPCGGFEFGGMTMPSDGVCSSLPLPFCATLPVGHAVLGDFELGPSGLFTLPPLGTPSSVEQQQQHHHHHQLNNRKHRTASSKSLKAIAKLVATRAAAEENKPLSKADQKRLRAHARNLECHDCGTRITPLWRRSEDKLRIVCNACGLYFLKYNKRKSIPAAKMLSQPEPTAFSIQSHLAKFPTKSTSVSTPATSPKSITLPPNSFMSIPSSAAEIAPTPQHYFAAPISAPPSPAEEDEFMNAFLASLMYSNETPFMASASAGSYPMIPSPPLGADYVPLSAVDSLSSDAVWGSLDGGDQGVLEDYCYFGDETD